MDVVFEGMAVTWVLLMMAAMAVVVVAVPYADVKCERRRVCNGMMCDDICVIGTVQLDAWVSDTLSFQRALQFNRSLISYEMPGTHNGGIALDYEMGIEAEYLTQLLLPIWGPEWSQVTIANQAHAFTDQLRMGVRHIEIDLYHMERLGGVRVCHWPVCPPDFYIFVKRAAEQQGIELDWECAALGCDERKPFYEQLLRELYTWLQQPENRNEVVTLYLDNKNIGVDELVEFAALNEDIVGDIVFRPTHKAEEYPERWPTIAELVAKNRRLIIEQQNTDWKQVNVSEAIFWTPSIWDGVQFGPQESLEPFPSCKIDGHDNYNTKQSRSLDGSLTLGPAFLWDGREDYPFETVKAMADCSVQVQSLDQISPTAMEYFIWSWRRDEPGASAGCAVMNGTDGRWILGNCIQTLRAACSPRDATSSPTAELAWTLSTATTTFDRVVCPTGYVFGLPVTGRMNSVVNTLAAGEPIWLNYRQ